MTPRGAAAAVANKGASVTAAGLPASPTAGQALPCGASGCCSVRVCHMRLDTAVLSVPAAWICHMQTWAQCLRPWKAAMSTGVAALHLHLAKASVAALRVRTPCLMDPSSTSGVPATHPRAAGRAVVAAGAGRISVVEGVAAHLLAAGARSAAAPKTDGGVHLSSNISGMHGSISVMCEVCRLVRCCSSSTMADRMCRGQEDVQGAGQPAAGPRCLPVPS